MKKSKFVSLSQLASKATGGAYGGHAQPAPSLPPSVHTPTGHHHPSTPGGGGGGRDTTTMDKKRATWADRVRDKLPPLEPNEYEVLWERGVLGVIFLESEKDGIPYVSKATESCISPLVKPGDILKFVNDVRSEKHSFSEFFKILATMKKPVLLRFERPSPADSRMPPPPASDGSSALDGPSALADNRSISANDLGGGGVSRATAMKDAAKALAAKVQRSQSIPPTEKAPSTSPSLQKPVARGTFWRGSSKELQTPQSTPTPKTLGNMPATPKTPRRREMQSPVAKQKYDGDTDTSDSPNEPWEDDERNMGDEYQHLEVYWETGSLGLFFGEERGTGYPVITRSTPGVNPSVHRKVQVNDVLLAANGVRSADFTFEAFFARLQQMSKPVKLVFRRKNGAPGTPPLQTRKTSIPEVAVTPAPPPAPMSAPQPRPTMTTENRSSVAASAASSRPSRLQSPSRTADSGSAGIRGTHSALPVRHNPPPPTKPRSTSVETRSLMEEERSPAKAADVRGKTVSRPDIMNFGSPTKKSRPPPPSPPSPPVQLSVDSAPSPREQVEKKPRIPSPPPTTIDASNPTNEQPPSSKPGTLRPDVLALVDNFESSPREADQNPQVMATEVESTVDEGVAASEGEVIDEGVAVGVPVESTEVFADEYHGEATVVAEAVHAEVIDDFSAQSSSRMADSATPTDDFQVEVGLPVPESSQEVPQDENGHELNDTDDTSSQTSSESESDEGEPLDAMEQEDPDISGDLDSNNVLSNDPKNRGSIASPSKQNKAAINASLAKYRKKSKNSRPMVKLPAISEDNSQTVPLVAPNAVNTNVQVRGRTKPKPSLVDTPDSSTYLVKWKEGRSVGLQLREVRIGKGTFPLVVDICKEPCCEVLKHVCIGDLIVEINGRNCSTMGVKKTVNFLKTSAKTMLLKFRRGPAYTNDRVSAYA